MHRAKLNRNLEEYLQFIRELSGFSIFFAAKEITKTTNFDDNQFFVYKDPGDRNLAKFYTTGFFF